MVKDLTVSRERDSSLELYRIVGMFAIVDYFMYTTVYSNPFFRNKIFKKASMTSLKA